MNKPIMTKTLLDAGSRPLVGIELGGTKCICTLGSGPDDIAEQVTVPTTTPDETLGAIGAVLHRWWHAGPGFAAIGVGCFGPLDLAPDSPGHGRLLATTKPGWRGADMFARLTRPFPVPARLDTDVNAAALAEGRWGAGIGHRNLAYITVGTGIGVGLLVDGRTTYGLTHCELGHMRVPRANDDFPSICPFHSDCAEGLASGPAIARRVAPLTGTQVPPDHPVWSKVADTLAALCHALVCGTAPTRIIIGGGVATGQAHLIPRIGAALTQSLNGYVPVPTADYVVPAALGGQAGPLGSLALAEAALQQEGAFA